VVDLSIGRGRFVRLQIVKIPALDIFLHVAIGVAGIFFMFATGVDNTPVEALPVWFWLFIFWLLALQIPIGVFRGVAATSEGTSSIGRIALERGIAAVVWLALAVVVALVSGNRGGLILLFGAMGLANLVVMLLSVRRLRLLK